MCCRDGKLRGMIGYCNRRKLKSCIPWNRREAGCLDEVFEKWCFKPNWIVQLSSVNPVTVRHFSHSKLLAYKCLNYAKYRDKHFYYASEFEDHQ